MKKLLILVGLAVVAAAGYYFISPLFNTVTVNDELPVEITTPLPSNSEPEAVASGFDELSPEDQKKMLDDVEKANADGPKAMDDDMPTLEELSQELADTPEPAPAPEPIVAAIMDTIGHPAEGTVRVINTAEGQVIRFENFKTINGPQLHLYLSKDIEGNDFIDLGPIRGTEGNINYVVPEGVDLSEYRYVMHWCVPFGVLFNYADLAG